MGFEAKIAKDCTYHKADPEVVSDSRDWFQCKQNPETTSVSIGGEQKPIEADVVAEKTFE